MARLAGKVALVTGATSGIGRATALAFAREGAKVVLTGRRAEEGEKAVQAIQDAGGEAINAGVEGALGPITELTEKQFDETIAINLKGTWLSLKHEIPAMLLSGGGSIINNGTIVGMVGTSIYGTSKAGVIGLTRSIAMEYAKAGIRVNTISPGAVETEMFDRFTGGSKEAQAQFGGSHPIGRAGRPNEIADAALWLASDESSFVTGQNIAVDGGFTAQ